MEKTPDYTGVAAVMAVTTVLVHHLAGETEGSGALTVSLVTVIYLLWLQFVWPRLRQRRAGDPPPLDEPSET
ncbi:hypothetical protein [Aeromicrobium sp.]|uniref:hypothetical protein n=1 Tax=Aeromicrobium sp. TaxID=1871063 RepID=UPI003517358D